MDNRPAPEQRPTPAPLPPVEPTPGAPVSPTSDGTLGGLIPYKNSSALIAYYLGVFSLACGPLLGLPAFILGLRGLKYYKAHPEAKGKAHAWVGLIMGGIWIVLTLIFVVLTLIGLVSSST